MLTRGEIDGYTEYVKGLGAKGLAWIKVNERAKGAEGLQSPIVKNLSAGAITAMLERTQAEDGDIVFFGAGKATTEKKPESMLAAYIIEQAQKEE